MRLLVAFFTRQQQQQELFCLLSRAAGMQARTLSSWRGVGAKAATHRTPLILPPPSLPSPPSSLLPPLSHHRHRSFSSSWTTSSKPSLLRAAAAAAAEAAGASASAASEARERTTEAEEDGVAATASSTSSSTATTSASSPLPPPRNHLPPGAFAHLPVVPPADEHFSVAARRAARVRADPKIKNEAARARSWAARRLDALGQELCTPLGKMVAAFPSRSKLHPFERALLDLTLGIGKEGRYEATLARVDAGRRATLQAAKEAAGAAARCKTKKEALEAEESGKEAIEKAWRSRAAQAVDSLKDVAKALRRLPVVDTDGSPTLALVGAPNVGKSSLVRALSSGEPAVADYPFTTRSVALGHFYVGGSNQRGDVSGRRQVTDTPGLLRRPQEDRNAMELLTLACLDHLPRVAVAFVADGTGLCGTSVEDQWALRRELREKYGARIPWVDVLTKADLLAEEYGTGGEEGRERLGNGGVAERRSSDSLDDGGENEPEVVSTPEELSAALPRAVKVSTPEGLGLDELKEAVMEAMEDL